jgi:hypothetical protein
MRFSGQLTMYLRIKLVGMYYVAYSTLCIQCHYKSTSKERRHALGRQLKNLEFDTLSFLKIYFHLQFVKETEMAP